jgi:hypothetical protein
MNLQDRIPHLRRPRDYWDNTPEIHHIFAGKAGFDWFLRRAEKQLVDSAALVHLGNRKFVDSETFIAAALLILRNEGMSRKAKNLSGGAA